MNRNTISSATAWLLPAVALGFLLFAARGQFVSADSAPLVFAAVMTVLVAILLFFERRPSFRIRLLIAALTVTLGWASVLAHREYKAAVNAEAEERALRRLGGGPAPALDYLQALNLNLEAETALRPGSGKLVLLDFWATSCSPCLEQMPEVEQLHGRYRERGLVVFGLTRYYGEPEKKQSELDQIRRFAADLGATYPLLVAPPEVHEAYSVSALPTAVLIGRRGEILEYGVGIDNARRVLDRVREILDGEG